MANAKVFGADAPGSENSADDQDEIEVEETEQEETEDEDGEKAEGDDAEADDEADAAEDAKAKAKDEDADGEDDDDKKPSKAKLRRERAKARIATLEDIAQRESDRADAAAATLRALSEEAGPEPKESEYDSPNDYIAAKAAWEADRRAIVRQKKAQEAAATTARQDSNTSKNKLFRERAMALTERYPDIEAKVFNDNSLPISQAMAEVIMDSERGPEVAYYLASHREEASRIQSMAPLAAAKEIGRIEATLAAPKPRTVTKAPKPAPTLSGGNARTAKDPDRMTTEEWLEWRNAQLRKKAS